MFVRITGFCLLMSQIDSLLNFVAGNTENRKVMSSVDDGALSVMRLKLDVFSWLLINCDLFTLNNDNTISSSSNILLSQESTNTTASEALQQVVYFIVLTIILR